MDQQHITIRMRDVVDLEKGDNPHKTEWFAIIELPAAVADEEYHPTSVVDIVNGTATVRIPLTEVEGYPYCTDCGLPTPELDHEDHCDACTPEAYASMRAELRWEARTGR